MTLSVPTSDGQVIEYSAVVPRKVVPRIYYVNGIQTTAEAHAQVAVQLSILTEHSVFGVYNATAGIGIKNAGFVVDFLQCVADWISNVDSKLLEKGVAHLNALIDTYKKMKGNDHQNPTMVAETIRRAIPRPILVKLLKARLATYNKATASLFDQLNTHLGKPQYIIAHSQGNLITSDALWSMVIAHGEGSLANMKVYSFASPTPAWPMGIRGGRHKDYGFTNDIVTYADLHNWSIITDRFADGKFGRTAGDWRQYGSSAMPGTAAHDVFRNIYTGNFSERIRFDLHITHSFHPKPTNPAAVAPKRP